MDLHNRYLRISTLDISVLQTVTNNLQSDCKLKNLQTCKHVNDTFALHHRFVQFYNNEMTGEQLDINKLEICRMLLCQEYQFAFNATKNHDNKIYLLPADAEKIGFSNIGTFFPPHYLRNSSEILVLYDIISLQMILYCNTKTIKQHLQNFFNSSDVYFTNSSSRIMYMKLLEYFLGFLPLYQFLRNDSDNSKEEELKEFSFMYLKVIKSWLKIKEENFEWRLFASMLPILAKTFAPESILFPLWDYILNKTRDLKDSLIVLSIMADTCFTSSYSMDLTYIHCDVYTKSAFWLIILKGLQSPLQQYRKQALYLMRKTIDSLNETFILKFVDSTLIKTQIIPFICNKSCNKSSSIECIKQKFFLVYKALEEKQYHLVAPALTHINTLVKANKEHKSCNSFDIVWLQGILEKVLQHENNNIVKWGVSQICKLDGTMFNEQFLKLFVSVLNNTFLYECQPNEECPEIVKELSIFFSRAKETNLLNNFLKKVSKVAWGPVAIFYIIHTLRAVSYKEVQCYWQVSELNAIKSLVQTNLNMHSHILRTASQIELLRTISNYVQKIDNLILVANILAVFSSEESLKRGITPWNIVTTWLRKVLVKEDAIMFVEDICSKYLYKNISSEINLKTFALLIYLLHDANLILSSKTCRAGKALNNWLCMLNGINMRPYADIRLTIDAVEFITHLLNLSTTESLDSVTDLILLYIHTTFKFLIKNVRKMATELKYEDYTRYTTLVSSHIINATLFMSKKDINNYAENLQNESICLLRDTKHQNLQYLYGLHILHLSQNILVLPLATTFYAEHLLNVQAIPRNVNNDNTANLKGKIASEYYLLLSKLMRQYLMSSPVYSWISTATLLSNLLKFLELGGTEIISETAMILTIMVDNKVINHINDRETLEYIFKSCWRCAFVNKKNNIFWTAMHNLTGVIINNNFFILPNAQKFITEFVDQLIEEGENIPKFKRILLSKMKQLNECNLLQLGKPLLSCLLHGFVLRRDQKIENHAHLFIMKHLNQYYSKHILASDYNNDAAVRAEATVLLHKIISHLELNYAAIIVPLILEILEKYKNKRYFNDSYLHKLKHRLIQILLLLEPVLNEELVALLQEKLCDLILLESNQHSVRLMQEWLIIRIFKKNINLHYKLWTFFTKSIEKRPGCTISVASIIYHVAQLLSNDNQRNFIQTALPYIAQCCLAQQFNVRLYNQFILTQLYALMKKANDDDSISEYKGMYQAALASLQQDSLVKNSTRIQDDFHFSSFHPINDYSLQTIYYELPRLTNISSDEWISPDMFKAFMFKHNDNHPLQLYNIDSLLSKTQTSIYFTKSFTGDTESLANSVETYLEGLHNIQKKMDPSKSITPLYSDVTESMKKSIHQQDLHEEGLIVVASFINRPPNLGGIARTCEIFGVKALIITNLDYMKNKEFQSLSVSAERWINILQVKPHELQKYLFEKRNVGWSLIGAEQTANSINLLQIKFEKKTILILGNEKDGIPANFIPLFDMCVEIPQVGVTRSLNVHITAAICIWQYASQHILKKFFIHHIQQDVAFQYILQHRTNNIFQQLPRCL